MAKSVRTPKTTKSANQAKKQGVSRKKRSTGPKRKVDWEANHQIIREAFYQLAAARRRAPKISEIADRTGFSYRTVERHIKEIDFTDLTQRSSARLMTEDVLTGIARSAAAGNSQNAKLFLQLFHGYTETSRTEMTGEGGGPMRVDVDGIDDERRAATIRALLERAGSTGTGSDNGPDDGLDSESGSSA